MIYILFQRIKLGFLILFIISTALQASYELCYELDSQAKTVKSLTEFPLFQMPSKYRISVNSNNKEIIEEFFNSLQSPVENVHQISKFSFYINNYQILQYFHEHDPFFNQSPESKRHIQNTIGLFQKIDRENLKECKKNFPLFLTLYSQILTNNHKYFQKYETKKFEIITEFGTTPRKAFHLFFEFYLALRMVIEEEINTNIKLNMEQKEQKIKEEQEKREYEIKLKREENEKHIQEEKQQKLEEQRRQKENDERVEKEECEKRLQIKKQESERIEIEKKKEIAIKQNAQSKIKLYDETKVLLNNAKVPNAHKTLLQLNQKLIEQEPDNGPLDSYWYTINKIKEQLEIANQKTQEHPQLEKEKSEREAKERQRIETEEQQRILKNQKKIQENSKSDTKNPTSQSSENSSEIATDASHLQKKDLIPVVIEEKLEEKLKDGQQPTKIQSNTKNNNHIFFLKVCLFFGVCMATMIYISYFKIISPLLKKL
jgi:hypothetical protein